MVSFSKHQRLNREGMITHLPSCIKTKILSCLPTKDVLRTSILSRKWKRSWTSVTCLDFDDYLGPYNQYHLAEHRPTPEDFTWFVTRVLMLHDKTSLQRFSLRCNYKGSLVNTWITTVLGCCVQELNLSVPIGDPSFLPVDMFRCKTLVSLKLDGIGNLNVPASVCLPNLKIFHLTSLRVLDDESIRRLLSGFPVLEELNLRECISDAVSVVPIVSPFLTTLTLESLHCDGEEPSGYEIVLDTPALEFFGLSDYKAKGYNVGNLSHLIKGVINIGAPDVEDEDEYAKPHLKAVQDVLTGMSQVRSLYLSEESMQAIHLCNPAPPVYVNLTTLDLSTSPDDICYLPKFLKNSPYLETLHLRLQHGYTHDFRVCFPTVPSCFRTHLKVIKIDNVKELADGRGMVQYFLENATVLEKLTLDCRQTAYGLPNEDAEKKAELFRKLQMLRRSSNVCKVDVI